MHDARCLSNFPTQSPPLLLREALSHLDIVPQDHPPPGLLETLPRVVLFLANLDPIPANT